MGGDEGDLTYNEIVRYVGEKAEANGDWICVLGLGRDKKVVGRGTSLDGFVETMLGDHGTKGSDGFGFSVGRVKGDGTVEIPVLCSSAIGAYYGKIECLRND